MQLHHASQTVDPGAFTARLNTAGPAPFVHVEIGGVRFYADTPEECDAAIRVWVEAKRLLLGEPQPGPAALPNLDHVLPALRAKLGDAELDHIAIEGTLS